MRGLCFAVPGLLTITQGCTAEVSGPPAAQSLFAEAFSALTAAVHKSNPLSQAQTTWARAGEGPDRELL